MVEPVEKTEVKQEEEKNAKQEVKYYEWSSEMTEKAQEVVKLDETSVTVEFNEKLEKEAKRHWDIFYKNHKTGGYKDRHYIKREF